MRKAIYTVITGGYDKLLQAPTYEDWDKIAFVDENQDPKGWDLRLLEKSENPLIQSRDYKIRSHIHLSEYDLVCYMDGNQKFIQVPPNVPTWFRHTRRKNIFQEAEQIIKNGRFKAEDINQQIEYYKKEGYQDRHLYLNGFFVRKHDENINKLHDVWFKETCKFTPRDQLSLPFAIWKTGIYPMNIKPEGLRQRITLVTYAHKKKYG